MKTISTLLLSTIFSVAAMAYDGTRLSVTSVSNQKIFVEVDGRRYDLNRNTVTLSNIRPGTHNVRVLREMKRKGGWNLGNGNRREEVIYSIKVSMRNGYHFDILVNRFGKVMIDERRIDYNDDWYSDDEDVYSDRNEDRDYEDSRNPGGRDDRDYDDDRNRRDDDPVYDDRYNRSMKDIDFTQAKESLRKEWFENKRLASAKYIIERNYFTSQQVKELMLLFTFENNRLDIAKFAYSRTVDQENYLIVNDAFSFSNHRDRLREYIQEFEEKQ